MPKHTDTIDVVRIFDRASKYYAASRHIMLSPEPGFSKASIKFNGDRHAMLKPLEVDPPCQAVFTLELAFLDALANIHRPCAVQKLTTAKEVVIHMIGILKHRDPFQCFNISRAITVGEEIVQLRRDTDKLNINLATAQNEKNDLVARIAELEIELSESKQRPGPTRAAPNTIPMDSFLVLMRNINQIYDQVSETLDLPADLEGNTFLRDTLHFVKTSLEDRVLNIIEEHPTEAPPPEAVEAHSRKHERREKREAQVERVRSEDTEEEDVKLVEIDTETTGRLIEEPVVPVNRIASLLPV